MIDLTIRHHKTLGKIGQGGAGQLKLGGLELMPAGGAQRIWFPEMLSELKRIWSSALTWEELADFCPV